MAHLWVWHEDGWADDGFETLAAVASAPRILEVPRPGYEAWLLLAARGMDAAINGLPLAGGLGVLSDRDEIRWKGSPTLYFSTETLARVEPLPDSDHEMICPRCRQPIEPGSPAVRCPRRSCGVWHHASERYGCWAYAATCALCPQPTPLDAGYQWTPEDVR